MAKRHLQHIKSSQADKIPSTSDLLYGEIAINYATDSEQIFIKNSNNEIVPFVSKKVVDAIERRLPILIGGIAAFTTNETGADGFNNAQVGDEINITDFDVFQGIDYFNLTDEQEEFYSIMNSGYFIDTVSNKILKIHYGTDEATDDDTVIIDYIDTTQGRLMTDGNGVLFDDTLNICQIYEPRDVIPSTGLNTGIGNGGYKTTHKLALNKTYRETDNGVGVLTIEMPRMYRYLKNIGNYIFKGEVKVYKPLAMVNENSLIVSLPENFTMDTYKFENNETYTYVIEQTSNGNWTVMFDAPLNNTVG